jgi:hypothetical protein
MFVRNTAIATIAALALTAVAPSVASATPPAKGVTTGVTTATVGATDISARRRLAPGAAAAAVAAGVVGTGLAIAAARNGYYGDYYGAPAYGGPVYGGAPVYVAPGPGYYVDPSVGPGPYGYGTTVPYVNGHPNAGW